MWCYKVIINSFTKRCLYLLVWLVLGSVTLWAQPNLTEQQAYKEIDRAYIISRENADSALKMVNKLLLLEHTFNKTLASSIWSCKGKILLEMGHYEQALISSQKSLALQPSNASLCIIYNNIGNTHNYLGNFEQAAVAYIKAIDYSALYPNSTFPVCNVYYNLCTIFDQLEQYEKLDHYLHKGMEVALKEQEYEATANFLMLKALQLLKQKQYEQSLQFFDSSIAISEKHHKYISLHAAWSNKGHLYLSKSEPEKAIESFLEAEKIMTTKTINKNNIVSVYASLGDAYMLLRQYKKAAYYLDHAWTLTENIPKEKIFVLKKKSELAYLQNNHQAAYNYLLDYYAIRDSLNNVFVTNNVNELETKYRTAEKDKTIAENAAVASQQAQQIAQKNWWLILALLVVFILVILIFAWKKQYQNKLKLLALSTETAQLKARMDGEELERNRLARELHDGINSHLSGAIAYLEVLARKQPQLETEESYTTIKNILSNTSTEVRQISHNLVPNQLLANGLEHAIENYIQQFQTTGSINWELQCYGAIQNITTEIALPIYRILQELIQNIVKHAQASEAIILLQVQEKFIAITIEDNGIGMDLSSTDGIGISNIKQRVSSLNGTLAIDTNAGKGTVISITLPV